MNTKRLILISLLALIATLALSACSSAPSATWYGLTADTERAYLSGGSFVYAINLKDGSQAWKYPAEADSKLTFYATPTLTSDGQLLVGSAGSTHPFISLDPATGKETWAEHFTLNKGAWMASALVFNQKIYAPNTDGFLYILDLKGKPTVDPIAIGGTLWSAPVTDGKLIYITSLDHHLHIIDPANLSSKSVDIGGAATSSPAVATGGVYVGSFNSTVQLVSTDGKTTTIEKAKDWVWGSPIVDGKTLYYADLKGNVVSFDLADNKQNWTYPQKDDSVVASLLLQGNQIYVVTEDGNLTALDKTGKSLWTKTVGGNLYTTPVASGGLILVTPYQESNGLLLAAYDINGKQSWTFTPAK